MPAFQGEAAAGFQAFHHLAKGAAVQREQPVQMVGHDHPRKGIDQALLLAAAHFVYEQATVAQIVEQRKPVVGNRREEVAPPGLGVATEA